MLPTVKIGSTEVSRLIVGGNPFSGNSHFSEEMNWQMRDYFTTVRIKDTLARCSENGMLAGLGTHMPEVVRYAQEHDWGVDFYVTSVYNLSLEQDRVSSAITGNANTGERLRKRTSR